MTDFVKIHFGFYIFSLVYHLYELESNESTRNLLRKWLRMWSNQINIKEFQVDSINFNDYIDLLNILVSYESLFKSNDKLKKNPRILYHEIIVYLEYGIEIFQTNKNLLFVDISELKGFEGSNLLKYLLLSRLIKIKFVLIVGPAQEK